MPNQGKHEQDVSTHARRHPVEKEIKKIKNS